MGEAAFTVERDAAGTSILHYSTFGNEAVQAHTSAEVTGLLGAEHGVHSGVLIGPGRVAHILLGRLRDGSDVRKVQRLVLEQRLKSGVPLFRLIKLKVKRGDIVT